ncbi:MAG: 1-acyl-sn-glycerol-3-phosphate acyltransferase [Clostridia bacterium]|nr:1-acyl-sn-glycerol-3-phosphate acyltransferase [Clostridia bacterium]
MSSYGFLKALFKYPMRLLYRVKVEGRENEPDTPYLVCANHSSFCDPILITATLKQKHKWLAKKQLKDHAFMRLVFRITGAVTIDREGLDTTALHACIDALKAGTSVGIFPQGTRMPGVVPQKDQALPGFSLIACMAQATVLPVSIVTKSLRPRLFRRTRLIIHKPVPYEEYTAISEKPTKPEISYFLFDKVCEPFGAAKAEQTAPQSENEE